MLLVLQIAQYEAVALEVKKLLLVLFWTVFRIMPPDSRPSFSQERNQTIVGPFKDQELDNNIISILLLLCYYYTLFIELFQMGFLVLIQ